MSQFIGLFLLLLMALPWPLSAHNGAVAIAVPVEGIVVDGDLSDCAAHSAQRSHVGLDSGDGSGRLVDGRA